MIAILREWFNPRDPLVRSQLLLIALTALGLVDYFNAVFLCALEIPLGILLALLCFGRERHVAWRYLVELVRDSAILAVLLFMLFAAIHTNERSPLFDRGWSSLRAPLFAGTAYYVVHFAPQLRQAFRAQKPALAWYRGVLLPQFALWFVLLVAAFAAMSLHSLLHSMKDSIGAHTLIMASVTAVTAIARIVFTHAFARVADRMEGVYMPFVKQDCDER